MDVYFDRIKPLFDKNGMKPKDIAAAIGCSPRDVYHWNNDGYKTYEKYYYQIAAYFGVSVAYVKGESDIPHDESHGDFPEVTMIGRASKKMSPADREKMLQLIRIAFPEAFDD